MARGVEPDECYIFGPAREHATRPDLAIEVIWTSGSINKLEIYRKPDVREVWIWRRGELTAYGLRGEHYEPLSESGVIINGEPVWREGRPTEARPGQVLTRTPPD